MQFLRTNTATRITVGPFIDVTDFKTPEVALTATNEKITFVVDTGGVPTLVIDANATASGGDNDFVHITGDDAGYYDLELTAAQTNYLGRARLAITYVTDHLPVFHEYMIMPALVYDTFFASSGGATFPAATLASTTNITAGTITTVTNLTNAPTSGDLTATMKTSVTTAATAATPTVLLTPGTGTGQISLSSGAVKTQAGIRKNQALANFPFLMTDSTNHNPLTGLTVTGTRSIDGAAFASGTIANMTEVSNGIYQCDLGAGDLNGETICFRFTATGADDLFITVVTEPA